MLTNWKNRHSWSSGAINQNIRCTKTPGAWMACWSRLRHCVSLLLSWNELPIDRQIEEAVLNNDLPGNMWWAQSMRNIILHNSVLICQSLRHFTVWKKVIVCQMMDVMPLLKWYRESWDLLNKNTNRGIIQG